MPTARTYLTNLLALLQHRARDPRVICGFVALLLLSLCVASAGIVKPREVDVLNPLASFSSSDFDDYFQATQVFLKGEDPYRVGQINDLSDMAREGVDLSNPLEMLAALEKLKGVGSYLYPPFTAFLLSPLAGLKVERAALVFQVCSMAALMGFFVLLGRWSALFGATAAQSWRSTLRPGAPIWPIAALSLLVLYRFLDGNAGNGNIGFFLILLCGAGLLLAFPRGDSSGAGVDHPRGLEFLGGLLLGLATVMKITPGFFGAVLIGGRRFVAILGMGCGALLALVAPALALGWRANLSALSNWNRLIVQTFSDVSFIRPWLNNQSISGAVGKWFIPGSDLKQAAFGLPWGSVQGAEQIAVFAHAVKSANVTLTLLTLLAGCCVAWRGWRFARRAGEGAGRLDQASGTDALLAPAMLELLTLCALVALLVSGVSWYHSYSILLVPIALFTSRHFSVIARSGQSAAGPAFRWRSFYGVALATFAFFGILQSLLPGNVREGLAMYSAFVVVNLALVLVLLWRLILGTNFAPCAPPPTGAGPGS